MSLLNRNYQTDKQLNPNKTLSVANDIQLSVLGKVHPKLLKTALKLGIHHAQGRGFSH
jgi:hypothetical protein